MRTAVVLTIVLLLLAVQCDAFFTFGGMFGRRPPRSANGGTDCAGCTVVITLGAQLAEKDQQGFDAALDKLCALLPAGLSQSCTTFINDYSGVIVSMLEAGFTSDEVCREIKFCTNTTCNLWPPSRLSVTPAEVIAAKGAVHMTRDTNPRVVQTTPWQWIEDLINRLAQDHLPVLDLDNDTFSTIPDLRGSLWRGKDCNDIDNTIHAGRMANTHPASVDHDCNGIFGAFPNGTTYEELYCGAVQHLGVGLVGDSAGAHFHIPPDWMHVASWNDTIFSGMLDVLAQEFDWPHMSSVTGFDTDTAGMCELLNVTLPGACAMKSLYQIMRERNLCIHRDYQNLGVNGANSGSFNSQDGHALHRSAAVDYPMLLVIESIGNDVCHPENTFSVMTTPEKFRANIIEYLTWLDSGVLPKGSHVMFLGLATGNLLFPLLHNRTHPIGVTYEVLYNYLICLESAPCWGWMSPDPAVRNKTQTIADSLSEQYVGIVANTTWNNFDIDWMPFPFLPAIQKWNSMGGEDWQLIEPVDGFHPNQIGAPIFTEIIWDTINERHPDWIPPVNPYNDLIAATFGDQGGY